MRGLLVLAVALVVGGCSAAATPAPTPSPTPLKVTGTLVLTDKNVNINYEMVPGGSGRATCSGTGGYSDIKIDAQVLIKDEAGKTVGAGPLLLDPIRTGGTRCAYTFSIPISAASFYAISIGGRAGPTYSAADLAAAGYSVALTLGQ